MKGHEVRLEYGLIVDVLGGHFGVLDTCCGQLSAGIQHVPMCSFHTDVRTTMINMHRLNRGGQGVRSPAGSLA